MVKTYAETLSALSGLASCRRIVEKHDAHTGVMLKSVLASGAAQQERLAAKLLLQLHEEIGTMGGDTIFLMGGKGKKDHKAFVTAFEKRFGVTVHHFDTVSNGVYLYLDEEDSDVVENALNSSKAIFDLHDDLGYILLRRGHREDVDFGAFGSHQARWIFVQDSSAPSNPPDLHGQVYDASAISKIERALREAIAYFDYRTMRVVDEDVNGYTVNAEVRYRVEDDSDMNRDTGYGPMKVPVMQEISSISIQDAAGNEVDESSPIYSDVIEWLKDRLANEEV